MIKDTEFFLADGTRLADLSDEALENLNGSFGKYMQVLGRTPHYRRKNQTNISLYQADMARIRAEQERRRSLNVVSLGGWLGYIKKIHPKRILWLWTAEEYADEYLDDAIPLLKIDGKMHHCPKDRDPSHYAIYDELYELAMDSFHAYMVHKGRHSYHHTVCIPGRMFHRIIHNVGVSKLVDDPLQDAPWTVLDYDPEDTGEGS